MKQTKIPFLRNLYFVGPCPFLSLFIQTSQAMRVSGDSCDIPGTDPSGNAYILVQILKDRSGRSCLFHLSIGGSLTYSRAVVRVQPHTMVGSLLTRKSMEILTLEQERIEKAQAARIFLFPTKLACFQLYTAGPGVSAPWPHPCQSCQGHTS